MIIQSKTTDDIAGSKSVSDFSVFVCRYYRIINPRMLSAILIIRQTAILEALSIFTTIRTTLTQTTTTRLAINLIGENVWASMCSFTDTTSSYQQVKVANYAIASVSDLNVESHVSTAVIDGQFHAAATMSVFSSSSGCDISIPNAILLPRIHVSTRVSSRL
jgi:hypothetical protein